MDMSPSALLTDLYQLNMVQAYLEAGQTGTAVCFGIPAYGTMAHSFIQSFDDETAAFEAFARARPKDLVLLIDTSS
ncbi:MAG: hypothetical protein EKK33_29065 [Bradyrhizobiaceae bacterium]|jgi:nicotinate phosphoribosyltransferase|nr:MAG: hypothetical protein EKK33_29065 [Bradyrhizobiaceae bacterium]